MTTRKIAVPMPLYSLEALYKACYPFLERAYVRLEGDPAKDVTVVMTAKPETSDETLARMADEFHNELLHHALRLKVASSNQKVREYILLRALSSAEGGQPAAAPAPAPVLDDALEREIEKLLAEVEKGASADPLKIAVPWEEKNKKSKASSKREGK